MQFNVSPRNTTVVQDENIRLSCRASGVPSPLITWQRKDRRPMPRRYRVANGDLVINDIQKQEEGVYQCIASNVLGAMTTQAQIIVNGKTVLV